MSVAEVLAAWERWDAHPADAHCAQRLEAALSAAQAPTGARGAVGVLRRGGATLEEALRLILGEPRGPSRAAAPQPGRRAPQEPPKGSGRYVCVSTDGTSVRGAQGVLSGEPGQPLSELVDLARALESRGELVIWVHASASLDLTSVDGQAPPAMVPGGEMRGAMVRVPGGGEPVWLMPAGDFDTAADYLELFDAVTAYHAAVGLAYVYSSGSTCLALIRTTQGRHRLQRTWPHPPEPVESVTAWATPSHAWSRPVEDGEGTHVQAFDRNGSYLAAWSGLNLSEGKWFEDGAIAVDAGPETDKPAGYWLLDLSALAELLGPYPNPFDRHQPGPAWYTTPLAQLAAELAHHAGLDLIADRVYWTNETVRALDGAAKALRAARDTCTNPAALTAIKRTYVRGVAWLDKQPDGDTLHRPHWRRSILDRHIANTFRGLLKAESAPIALSDVDCAYFPTNGTDPPIGLPIGPGLGQWKPAGPPVPLTGPLLEALHTGDTRAFVKGHDQ